MSAAVAGTTVQFLALVPVPPVPVVPPPPSVPAVPAEVVPACPPVPVLLLLLPPQPTAASERTGAISNEKRAILETLLKNMRLLPKSLKFSSALFVSILYTSIVVSCGSKGASAPPPGPTPLEDLQRSFIELRFGMFLHFGILTYTGSWAQPNLDISMFNPTQLDANQWADAAVSAGVKFGVLTTRHHDGFALWPSSVGNGFNVASTPWKGGQGDVVREYVDAFRAHNLLPGLYYSVWDSTQAVGGVSTSDSTPVT